MKLKKLRLKNFRGYFDTEFPIANLNVLIGQNDVGKSTILDALDIFFNDAPIDIHDINVYTTEENPDIEITCSFEVDSNEPITLDASENTATSLYEENLLNKENLLEISKKYVRSGEKIKKPIIQIIARHPSNFENGLICLKKQELLKLASDNHIIVSNKNIKKEIRRAIFEQYPNLDWKDKFIISVDTKESDIIPIFNKFKDDFPAFMIFRADRTNTDKDKEVNETTKAITKAAVIELDSQFNVIRQKIAEQIQELANKTLLKLKEFNEDIATELKPNIDTKTLDSLFSFTFNCENGISFNKRGSGIKRLMLLSFFLAEAERKNNTKNIIYAIEEPETSQHPNFQNMLFSTLKELSNSENHQIILTTHTPEIVKLIDKQDLIFLQKDKETHSVTIETGENITISKVAETLGILPFVSYKGVIFVEGPTDERFLKNLSKIPSFGNIIDLTHFTFIRLHGGGNVENWIKEDYLKGTNVKCLYFKDRDDLDTPAIIQDGNVIKTTKREIENYIPIALVEKRFNIMFEDEEKRNWDNLDIAKILYEKKNVKFHKTQKSSENAIKSILQSVEVWNDIHFTEESTKEIISWFQKMKAFFEE